MVGSLLILPRLLVLEASGLSDTVSVVDPEMRELKLATGTAPVSETAVRAPDKTKTDALAIAVRTVDVCKTESPTPLAEVTLDTAEAIAESTTPLKGAITVSTPPGPSFVVDGNATGNAKLPLVTPPVSLATAVVPIAAAAAAVVAPGKLAVPITPA